MTDVKATMDLIAVVPDADMEATACALLSRPSALGIRPIAFDVKRHVHGMRDVARARMITCAFG